MSKNIKLQNQMNVWGRQVDGNASMALEPQRVDLFLVDLQQAALNIAHVADERMPPQYPQFVRSINLPEVRVKAEPFRRDSVPYNMPSWDDPVDPVKITFLVDTYDSTNQSNVCDLLDVWVALTRAGRGARNGGYETANQSGYFLLDATFKVACQFDIYVSLLRGSMPSEEDVTDAQRIANLNALLWNQYTQQLNTAKNINNTGFGGAGGNQATFTTPVLPTPPQVATSQITPPDMVEHTKWVLRKCWCAGYKMSDLNYGECQLATIEATFYPEAVERETIGVPIIGSPTSLSGNPVPTTSPPVSVPSAASTATGKRINRGGQLY